MTDLEFEPTRGLLWEIFETLVHCEGRETASESMSMDYAQDMLEEWFAAYDDKVLSEDKESNPNNPWNHRGHEPVQHRDGNPPWCESCGWTSPKRIPAQQIKGTP